MRSEIKERLLRQANYTCEVCGRTACPLLRKSNNHGRVGYLVCSPSGHTSQSILTVDHLVPKALGGKLHENNHVVLCSRCNTLKSDTLPRDWMKTLSSTLQQKLLPRLELAEQFMATPYIWNIK